RPARMARRTMGPSPGLSGQSPASRCFDLVTHRWHLAPIRKKAKFPDLRFGRPRSSEADLDASSDNVGGMVAVRSRARLCGIVVFEMGVIQQEAQILGRPP